MKIGIIALILLGFSNAYGNSSVSTERCEQILNWTSGEDVETKPKKSLPEYEIIDNPEYLRKFERRLQREDISQHPTRAYQSRIKEGVPLRELFVVTHQSQELAATSAEFLQREEFEKVPRLFLASPVFPIRRPMRSEVSMASLSTGGEIRYFTIAETVHLMGGYSGNCLCKTTSNLFRNFVASDLKEMTFVMHTDYIYDKEGTMTERIGQTISHAKDGKFGRFTWPRLRPLMPKFWSVNVDAPSPVEFKSVKMDKIGPKTKIIFEYTLVQDPSRKVTVIFQPDGAK